jgi:hypothetical protein
MLDTDDTKRERRNIRPIPRASRILLIKAPVRWKETHMRKFWFVAATAFIVADFAFAGWIASVAAPVLVHQEELEHQQP